MAADVVVLGAGIIGVSVALQLARRGKSVVLVDRRGPGEETSFGNAGLIQREGVVPYGFTHDLALLLRYSLNNRIDVRYRPSALPRMAPFLGRYWYNSAAMRHATIARAYTPLIEHSVSEHSILIDEAKAGDLIVKNGWMQAYRTAARRMLIMPLPSVFRASTAYPTPNSMPKSLPRPNRISAGISSAG